MKTSQGNSVPQEAPREDASSWRARDTVVLLLCLAGAATGFYLFAQDMFQTIRMKNAAPIGTISFKFKTAQRRLLDRVLWDRLRQESPVYDGDTIRTAELSEAVINFPGGAKLDLDENTLIQIQTSGSKPRIDLEGGFVNPNGGSTGIEISAGGRLIEAAPGSALSVKSTDDGMELRVSEGSVLFTGADGKSRQESAGAAISLDSAGFQRVEPAAVVFAPRPNARLLNPREEPLDIAFSWNRVNLSPEDVLRLEIAEDRNFSRIVQTIGNVATTAQARLPSGNWHWRIMRGATALAAGYLTVIYAPAPSLITPFDGQAFTYRSRQPSLRFQWARSAEAASWILEAADNPEFVNPQIRTETRIPSLTTSELGAGLWYWRVLPEYIGDFEGTPLYSAPASFTIQQNGLLEPPVLVSPAAGASVNIAAERNDVYFSWRTGNEAVSYTIRIARDRGLQNPVIKETAREAFFVYGKKERVLEAGQYYWGVSQTDAAGSESPVSPARPFTALANEVIQRAVYPPDNFTVAETLLPDIRFTWKSNLPFETRFQISDSADFSRLTVNEVVSGESFQGRSLPPGAWHWRISAEGEMNGQHMVFQTPPRSFITASVFPAPQLTSPVAGEQLVVHPGEAMVFRWQPVSGADYYQFRLYTDTDRSRSGAGVPVYAQNSTVDTAQSLMPDNFPEGAYYWTAQAFTQETPTAGRRAGLIGGERFTLRKLSPLTLEAPAAGARIEGLTAREQPIVLRWSVPEAVGSSRFILSRNANPLSGTPARVINNPGRTISLSGLAEGTWHWTIQAETRDGLDISAAAPRSFQILPIPLLPEAQGLLPENGSIVGPEELRQTRSLAFNWQPVEGANAYIFTLLLIGETDGQSRQIISIGPQERTSVTLEDLSLLNQGVFVWQVEAVSATTGGAIERRGRIGESRFTIDIPSPQPAIGGTGTLYGK